MMRSATALRRLAHGSGAALAPRLAGVLAVGLVGALVGQVAPAYAQPVSDHEMPFPCAQQWTGTTRPSHSPSVHSIDWNRVDDLGDPVVASAPGVVSRADATSTRGYGRHVVVDHGSGESTVYAHLQDVHVVTGQRVDQGALLGAVGSTGNCSGPHLHYEQRLDGRDVEAWFGGAAFVYGTTQASGNCVDLPLAGNMLGDRTAELVVYRRAPRSVFLVQRPAGRKPKRVRLGTATDEPVLGDWDGNGRADVGVWSPATGVFTLRVGAQPATTLAFGTGSDQPVAGDWDGDGVWEVGVRSPATGGWTLRSADGSVRTVSLGDAADIPVTGDWDGDGTTDVGVFDPSTATFTLRRVDAEGLTWTAEVQFGSPGDLPVTGDWDGNATTDVGVWNPTTATFSERRATAPTAARSSTASTQFGRPR
jgi:murein DD-endopeptidase MepM/ murein hydrolase activator NlpD